jgi:hypothetical protein
MKAGLTLAVAAGLCALAIGGGAATAGADTAAKRADCGPRTAQQATSTYASYIQSLKVRNTSCGKGWKVVKAFHECRKEHGGRDGRCKSPVLGYHCDEGKRDGVAGVSYRARVVCKKGAKKVIHEYQMNL